MVQLMQVTDTPPWAQIRLRELSEKRLRAPIAAWPCTAGVQGPIDHDASGADLVYLRGLYSPRRTMFKRKIHHKGVRGREI